MEDIRVHVEDGNRLSLDKMQKGKDDAWYLMFGQEFPPVDGEYCDVWEGTDFTGF